MLTQEIDQSVGNFGYVLEGYGDLGHSVFEPHEGRTKLIKVDLSSVVGDYRDGGVVVRDRLGIRTVALLVQPVE